MSLPRIFTLVSASLQKITFVVSTGFAPSSHCRILAVLHMSHILLSSLSFLLLLPKGMYIQFTRFNSTHSCGAFSSPPSATSNAGPMMSTCRLLPDGGYSIKTACRSLQLFFPRASLSPTRTQHPLGSYSNRQSHRHSKAATHR